MLLVDFQINFIPNMIKGKVENVTYSYGLEPCGYTARLLDIYKCDGVEYIATSDTILIYPHRTYILATVETLEMPADVSGRIYCKSSLIRQGVAGFFGAIEPGYKGNISALFVNFSQQIVPLKVNEGFIQLQFEKLEQVPMSIYKGRYQNSKGITQYKDTFE